MLINCHKEGHTSKDCRYKKRYAQVCEEEEETEDFDESSSNTEYVCLSVVGGEKSMSWIIDSGATTHMVNNKDLFTNLDENKKSSVSVADKRNLIAQGTGEGYIKCKVGDKINKVLLTRVLFVPKLDSNLLSVKRFATNKPNKYQVLFEGDICLIMLENNIVLKGCLNNNLYQVYDYRFFNDTAFLANLRMWHRRLGHRNLEDIKILSRMNLINIKGGKDLKCEECIKAKSVKKDIPKSRDTNTTEILELIHSDVCDIH